MFYVVCRIKIILFIDAGFMQQQFSGPGGKQIVPQILINEEMRLLNRRIAFRKLHFSEFLSCNEENF